MNIQANDSNFGEMKILKKMISLLNQQAPIASA